MTASVLQWARYTCGYSIEKVVRRLGRKKVTPSVIEQWESGSAQPTYPQLKELAEFYKRPLALFFFPEPPEEESIENDFRRTLPSSHAEMIPSEIRYLVRQAKARQIDLDELQGEIESRGTIRDLRSEKREDPEVMAERIRGLLNILIDEQTAWKSPDDALKKWRAALEVFGVWIFKDAFKNDDYSGFGIYDEKFPLIYINNSQAKQRQIFTLFHELGHLLRGHAGVAFRSEPKFKDKHQQEEVFCNAFAAAFLVPKSELDHYGSRPEDETVKNLAKKYKVSFEVVLRRFRDKGLVSEEDYAETVRQRQQSYDEKSKKGKKGGGPSPQEKQRVYLGEKYIDLVFRQYYQQRIDQYQLADYLGMKSSSVKAFEELVVRG